MNVGILQDYMQDRAAVYSILTPGREDCAIVSEANFIARGHYACGEKIGIKVSPGDICYIEFGQAYLNECGFQHFGLVMSVVNRKALVIPMTSNQHTYEQAWDPQDHPSGRKNLMRIGKPAGMRRNSVLFLNDAKFINTARVIDIVAHLATDEKTFQDVKGRLAKLLLC